MNIYIHVYSPYEVRIYYFMITLSEIDKMRNMMIVFRHFWTIEEDMRYPLQNVSIAKMYLHMNILYP